MWLKERGIIFQRKKLKKQKILIKNQTKQSQQTQKTSAPEISTAIANF